MRGWLVVAIWLSISSSVSAAVDAGEPLGSAQPISRDEREVYDAILASWLGAEPGQQLVNTTLDPPPSRSDPEFAVCTKGLDFPLGASGEGRKTLVGVQFARSGITLIDGSQWKPSDPADGIAKGKSVDAAVEEGFANSLMSFSQIAFSRNGKDALVKFGMVCGSLCGSGSTVRLHKTGERWAVVEHCGGGWMS